MGDHFRRASGRNGLDHIVLQLIGNGPAGGSAAVDRHIFQIHVSRIGNRQRYVRFLVRMGVKA